MGEGRRTVWKLLDVKDAIDWAKVDETTGMADFLDPTIISLPPHRLNHWPHMKEGIC